MMKRIAALAVLVLMAVLPGCAANVSSADDPSQEIARLRQENAELRRSVQQGMDAPMAAPAPAPVAVPEHYGVSDRRPLGCPEPLTVEIGNRSDFCADASIDGLPVGDYGAFGRFPCIPPQSTVWTCLYETGDHVIMGTRFFIRGNQLLPDRNAKFHWRWHVSGEGNYHTVITLDNESTNRNLR